MYDKVEDLRYIIHRLIIHTLNDMLDDRKTFLNGFHSQRLKRHQCKHEPLDCVPKLGLKGIGVLTVRYK